MTLKPTKYQASFKEFCTHLYSECSTPATFVTWRKKSAGVLKALYQYYLMDTRLLGLPRKGGPTRAAKTLAKQIRRGKSC